MIAEQHSCASVIASPISTWGWWWFHSVPTVHPVSCLPRSPLVDLDVRSSRPHRGLHATM